MTAVADRTGETSICILRIESEPDRLLITMTVERYLHRGLIAAGGPQVRHFARTDDALDALAAFVRTHVPPGLPDSRPRDTP